jgi:hypothetical protein
MLMNDDRSIRQSIAWLHDTCAVIRATPALWRRWWPILCACEAEAARLEGTVAHRPEVPTGTLGAEVIDLAEWRRRKSAARPWHELRTGGVA